MKVSAETREKGDNCGRSNATGISNTNEDDGMQIYNAKAGYTEVRFMKGNRKGFNIARALKQFLAAAREQDDKLTIFPLAGIGNNLCIRADVPNSKAGIEQTFQRDAKFSNRNGKLRILNSQGIGQLKRRRSRFCVYLENQRVYINKAQLGEEDGITLGWTLNAYPDFCYRDDTKEAVYKMMDDELKGVKYALFPKTIKYKRSKYEAKMTTNGITLQVTKTQGIMAADLRVDMAEKWQRMTVKNGGTLFGKTFIQFGKEGDICDGVMTSIIQQQNFLSGWTKNALFKT
jgi:hypothetical protein